MTTTTSTPTPNQAVALAALSAHSFQQAATIGIHSRTLTGLVNAGYADRVWQNSSLRGGERWAYRITGRGIIALNKAQRAAKETSS